MTPSTRSLAALAFAAVLLLGTAVAQAPSSAHVAATLDSETSSTEAERYEAIAHFRANPGGLVPAGFIALAAASAERGDVAEAARWQLFGEYRQNADTIVLMRQDRMRETIQAGFVGFAIQERRDPAVTAYLQVLAPEAHAALLREVEQLDATTPRLYPPDWFALPDQGLHTNWSAAPATWPDWTEAELASARASLTTQFESQLSSLASQRTE